MDRAWHDHELGLRPGIVQALRVIDILIAEQIERADANEGRGQALQVSHARWHGVFGSLRAPRHGAQKALPAEAVLRRGPAQRANPGLHLAGDAGAIVEHGIDQALEAERHLAPVARQKREDRRMAAARALAHHRDSAAIDAQRFRIGVKPFQTRVIVLHRPGVGRLGCKAVFDRDDHAIELCRQFLHLPHRSLGRSGDIAAAMGVQDGRAVGTRLCVDHIDRHVGMRLADGNDPAFKGNGCQRCEIGEREGLAKLRQVGHRPGRHLREGAGELAEDRPQFGVDHALWDRIRGLSLRHPGQRGHCGYGRASAQPFAAVHLHPVIPSL